jgi:hypothetical protein
MAAEDTRALIARPALATGSSTGMTVVGTSISGTISSLWRDASRLPRTGGRRRWLSGVCRGPRAWRPLPVSKRSRTDLADSEKVPPAADRVTHHAEQRQDEADNQNDDADRPDNSDFRDESDDEKDYAEDDQGGS